MSAYSDIKYILKFEKDKYTEEELEQEIKVLEEAFEQECEE